MTAPEPCGFLPLPLITNYGKFLFCVFVSEFALILTSLVLPVLLIYFVLKTSLIHYNLQILLVLVTVTYLMEAVTRIGTMVYQANPDIFSSSVVFYVNGIRTNALATLSFCPLALLCERILGTYFARDYETVTRKWICLIIGIAYLTLPITLTGALFEGYINAMMFGILNVVIVNTGLFLFFIALKYNERKLKLSDETMIYSLSFKYQLKENIRTIQLFKHTALLLVVQAGVLSIFVPLIIILTKDGDAFDSMFTLFYIVAALSMNVICCVMLFDIHSLHFERTAKFWRIRKGTPVHPLKQNSEMYFTQYAWVWA